jgi:uncharacterized protein (TIGR02145 family)
VSGLTFAFRVTSAVLLSVAFLGISACGHTRAATSLPSVQDVDGNTYPAVAIGSQVWLGANLRTTRSPQGAPLPTHPPNADPNTIPDFGRLYSWESAGNACPTGWRLASDEDWSQLEAFLGGEAALLVRDPAFWPPSPAPAGTPVPLAVRPAGYHNDEGFESFFGTRAVFWTATRQDDHFVWSRVVSAGASSVRRAPQHPQYGFSVRCVLDTHAWVSRRITTELPSPQGSTARSERHT